MSDRKKKQEERIEALLLQEPNRSNFRENGHERNIKSLNLVKNFILFLLITSIALFSVLLFNGMYFTSVIVVIFVLLISKFYSVMRTVISVYDRVKHKI